MTIDRPITELLASERPLLSVEFFPPKNEEGGAQLLRTAEALRPCRPDFVSITYGAGGTTRERTFKYAKILRDEFGWLVMPHLTCVGSTKAELLDIVAGYHADGVRNIMALRGDPPKGRDRIRSRARTDSAMPATSSPSSAKISRHVPRRPARIRKNIPKPHR